MMDPRLVNVAMSRDRKGIAISSSSQYLMATQAARSVLAAYAEVQPLPAELSPVPPAECDQFSWAVEDLRRNAAVMPMNEIGDKFHAALRQVSSGTPTVGMSQMRAAASWRGHEIPLLLDAIESTHPSESQAVTSELKEDDALVCEAEFTMKSLLDRILCVRGSPVESGRLLASTWCDPCPPLLKGWLAHLSIALSSRSLEATMCWVQWQLRSRLCASLITWIAVCRVRVESTSPLFPQPFWIQLLAIGRSETATGSHEEKSIYFDMAQAILHPKTWSKAKV